VIATIETSRRPSVGKFAFAVLSLALASLALSVGSARAAGFADDFEDAGAYTGGKASYEGVPGSLGSATRESGEPEHGGAAGKASAWISWTPSKDQIAEIGVCSGMDTVLGVYTGTAVNALTKVTDNDENSFVTGCGAPDAGVRFEAKAGTKYMVAVDTKDTQKTFNVSFRTLPPNDNFADAIEVPAELPFGTSADNRIATKETGEPDAGGYVRGNTVWYRWTAPKSGRAVVSTCTAEMTSSGIGVYTGTAVNALTEVAGNAKAGGLCHSSSEAIFEAVEGTTYRIQLDGNARYGLLFLDIYWDATRSVAVTKSGSGEGTVTSEPAGIECGLICEADFYRGPAADYWKTRVTLTAAPATGSAFVGWSGEGCAGVEPVCELVIEGSATAATVDAEFEEVPSLSASGLGSTQSSSSAQAQGAPSSQASTHPQRKKPKCAKHKNGKKKAAKAAKRRRACKR
jgi:hypothetical protein